MSEKEELKGAVGRREAIKGVAATGLVAATGTHRFVHSAENHTTGRDVIKRENAEQGTRDWLLTKTRTVPGKINPNLLQWTLPGDRRLLQCEQRASR